MGFGGIGAIGTTFTDVGFTDNEARFIGTGFGLRDGRRNRRSIVTINGANHVPAIGLEALRGIVREPRCDLTVDTDAVVIVQSDELVQLPSTRQAAGFVADTFHQAAIAHEHVGMVVNDGVTRTVKLGGQQFFCQGKSYRIGDTLP